VKNMDSVRKKRENDIGKGKKKDERKKQRGAFMGNVYK